MITRQQTYSILADILSSVSITAILCTVFSLNRDLGNGIVSSKYFWFYVSMALLSVAAIPTAIIKHRERISFRLPDLLILLFCFVANLSLKNWNWTMI
jgi:glucan phosphoethanolaminetransferase (alkaline phosphatase superfamily)